MTEPHVIDRIQELNRLRKDLILARKRLSCQIFAQCQRIMSAHFGERIISEIKGGTEAESFEKQFHGKLKTLAQPLYAAVKEGKSHPLASAVLFYASPLLSAYAPVDDALEKTKREMGALAESLPVWEAFGKDVKGLSATKLAVIVGESGDLSRFATHSKLWRWWGVGLVNINGEWGRQRRSVEHALEHRYNPHRRAELYDIGTGLMKQKDTYKAVFDRRKAQEHEKAAAEGLEVVPAAKIRGRQGFRSEGQIRFRAQRYMEKKLLRDLWNAWRRCAA